MISFRKKYCLLGILLINLYSQPVQAQSITPANDGTGTVVNHNSNQFNITGGTLSQDQINLFHSFSQFGLNQNEIANFLSNPNIQNILGRVVGGDASIINGLIQVTGGNSNIFLMNPSGIIFGANAQLNVPASFTATTATGIGFGNNLWFNASGLNNYAGLVGDPSQFAFNINQPGSIINAGSLQVETGQNLSLIGGNVINTGTLTAPQGNITIASVPGSSVVKISQPGHLLSLEINPKQTSAPSNITALSLPQLLTGGNVSQATGVTVDSNGQVILTSSGAIIPADGGVAIASGNLNVAGEKGGTVGIFGQKVGVIGGNINASGTKGGGTILVGGDFQGKGIVSNAQTTFVSADSTINANASTFGNGGKVIVWADKNTHFYGNIDAKGGSISGNGGFVEVSGKEFLNFNGQVNTFAPNGNIGTLLLDPTDINIVASGGSASLANVSSFANPNTDGASSNINATLINNASSNVILQATGSIAFQAPINISQPGVGLTAQANDYILLSNITTNGGSLDITADFDNNGIGSIQDGLNYSLTTNGGNINLKGGGAVSDSSVELESVTINSGGGNITLTGVNNAGSGFPAININSSSSISSGGGNILLNGTSDGTGIFIQGASLNSGGGSLTLIGNGVNDNGIFLENVSLASGGGNLSLLANSANSVDLYTIAVDVNSGIGNLNLVADTTDISGTNFSGTGNLIIQPQTPNLDITIGGIGAADTTFLNSGELGSFVNGFNSITIGSIASSGAITLAGDVIFNDPVTLRSSVGSGLINTNGFNINGEDNAKITLIANQSITVNNITTNAADITLVLFGGSITTGNLNSYPSVTSGNAGNGGNITLSARGNISTQSLNSESSSNLGNAGNGGNIVLTAIGGNISTGNLHSSSISNSGNTENGGNINLSATVGNITTGNLESYSYSVASGNAKQGGDITLSTTGNNISTGVINSGSTSLQGDANNGGNIVLSTSGGNIETGLLYSYSFAAGNAKDAGDITFTTTQGNITTQDISSQSYSSGSGSAENGGNVNLTTTQGNISIGNLSSYSVSNSSGNVKNGGDITLTTTGNNITTGFLNSYSSANLGSAENGGDITVTTTAGDISTKFLNSSANSSGGSAKNGGDITLTTTNQGNISTENIFSSSSSISGTGGSGGDITFTTTGGNISTTDINSYSLSTSGNAGNGGDISLFTSNGNIFTKDLVSSSFAIGNAGNGGVISLKATNGSIFTKNINSSSINGGGSINILAQNQINTGQIDSSSSIGNGGNVTIDPITTIIDSINAQGGTNGFGGKVDITALATFRAIGTFVDQNGVIASISTAGGLGGGDITIRHPGIIPFIVGNANIQGTAAAITSGINNSIIPQREFLSNYTQENIRLLSFEPFQELKPVIPDFNEPFRELKTIIPDFNSPKPSTIPNITPSKSILTTSVFSRQSISNQLLQGNIEGAISSIEQFLSGEYTGYYGDELQLDAQPQTTETIQAALRRIAVQTGKKSAIVYIILQPDSLDLVVIKPSGKVVHRNIKVDREKLIAEVRTFRKQVTDVSSNGYQQSGEKLYSYLIAPIEATLTADKIDTLLFSVDGNLRSLPFAALYDGKNYLTQNYNISIIPSVTLMDTRYQSLGNSQILLMGASKFVNPNQDALPGVTLELPIVGKKFSEDRYFINQEFTIDNLKKQRQQRPTQIVHLATHGEFNPGDSSQSYIQFWGTEKLQINQIRNLGFKNPPVELLVLSACQTALGNEQVELGFAGLAIQAGVKSALASLWYVSDEGTLGLMNEFYQQLKNVPIKSEALRQAQIAMIQGKVIVKNGELQGTRSDISLPPELKRIRNKNLSHPYYWAAFTMIGSPW